MLRKWTGTFIDLVTLAATTKSLRSVPTCNGMDMLRIGSVSLAHFMPSGFSQSRLLHVTTYVKLQRLPNLAECSNVLDSMWLNIQENDVFSRSKISRIVVDQPSLVATNDTYDRDL